MSVSTGLQSQCVSGRAIKNDNSKSQLHLPSTGDANANKLALTRKDEGQTGEVIGNTIDDHASNPLPPLVARREAQDKLMIWGMAEQCVDPDLQGFEGNEEKEEEEEYGGEDSKGGGDEGLMSISSSSTASSVSVSVHRNDNERNNTEREMEQDIGAEREGTGRMEKIRENEKGVLLHSSDDHDCGALRSERGKERRGEQSERGERGSLEEARSLSENNVFDASLSVSAMSFLCSRLDDALDASGHPQTTASLSCAPDPNTNPDPKSNYNPNAKSYITTSAIIPGQCKKRAPSVDQNRNSTASKSQETPDLELHQYQRSPDQNVHHLNPDASSKVNELLCDQSVTHEQRTNHNVFTQRHNVRCFQANKSQQCSDGRMGLRMTEGEKERVPLPRRQQLVRPLCQSEPGKGNSLAEPIARWQTYPSQCTDADSKDTGHGGVSNRHTQDTLEINNAKVNSQFRLHTSYQPSSSPGPHQSSPASCPAQRETRPLGKQGNCAGQTSSPSSPSSSLERRRQYEAQSQFTYRRSTCFSPNQRATEPHCPSQVSPPSPLSTPQGSPRRQLQQPMSPSRIITGAARYPHGTGSSGLKPPLRSMIMSGIPKPRIQHHKVPNSPPTCPPKPKGVRPKIITYIRKGPQLKPQASDGPYQVSSLPSRLSAYTHSPSTNTPHTHPSGPNTQPCGAPESKSGAVLSASNLLYDKYRQEMQRKRLLHPGLMGTGLCPPGHTHTVPPTHTHSSSHTHTHAGPNNHTHSYTAPPKLGSKTESFYGQMVEKYLPTEKGRSKGNLGREDPSGSRTASQATQGDGSGILLHTGTELRPQLGLGAVARANPRCVTTTKTKMIGQGQRAALGFSQPVQSVSPATNRNGQENTGDQLRPSTHPAPSPASTHTSRTLLHKSGLTGLRAPGFTSVRLPPGAPGAGRLAGFGFVRSSSVSLSSSLHSVDSSQSDLCPRSSVCDDQGTNPPSTDPHLGGRPPHYRSRSLQPPSTPALPRRYLPAQPSGSPVGVRKESQRSSEITRSLPSSPKRLAVVPPKPQSPVFSRQRPAAGSFPPVSPRRVAPFRPQLDQQENLQREKEEAQRREREKEQEENEREKQREEVQRLQSRCDNQEEQLTTLRQELKTATLGLQAFIITTQHYCAQNESAAEKEKDMFLEIQRIRQEMASNTAQWERLQREKADLEAGFEHELQELQLQQEEELAAVEAELRSCHSKETQHLRAEHQEEVEEIRIQQQEQVEELTANHEAAILELRDMHNITMTTLHEEHARTMRDLRRSHNQQKMTLEEDFEKLRRSLQDQVDTLIFQNRSLKDKAKRFEEALRKSTDEQIVEALAPYQHIEQDLKSLKDVVVMKNRQIHQQEKKISDLERVAQKNVVLEERIQVLQQQNEDLMARIDNNLVLSRQLSEENANLQDHVEKESNEKKRLSRNNEELLWRLQTSPLCSPCSSPLHRSSSPLPSSPLFSSSPRPEGGAGFDIPSLCCGGHLPPTPTRCQSPGHRTSQNQSPALAMPTHGELSNQNPSSGPSTPAHRASPNHCHSPARPKPLMR